jgi:CRP-like cAMP-binding protein
MGLGKSVESERKITKTIRSEYLSRAFALDLNDISLGARLSFAKGSVTDRAKISTTHHESSLLNLPKWETGPQFEGLLSVVSRGDVALTARGRLEGGIKSKANGVRVDPSNKSRGVLDERKHPLAEPSPTKVAALRQVMLRSMGNKEQSGSDSTSMATNISSSHRSFGMCVDWRTGSAEGARVEIEAGTFSISGRRGSLLSRVPKAFKGGRSFPLGRGGTDHRQMLGIPSTTNSPVVVAAREALRLRFRTSIEAFAFMRSVEDVDRPDSDWTEPLNSDAVSKGFRILHIRVDVSQLFQQIGRDEYRLYPPTTSFLLATPLSTVRTRIFTGSDRSMNNGFVVTLESWNQHMAWHPPLLQPCRAIVQARAILSEIRATAIRASAAANAVKSLTVPTGPRALQDTLTFIHANRELFQVFSAPISTFNHLEDGRPKTAPFEELRLSYRDMEALYRQVNILPGWMTSIGLLSIYNQVRSLDLPREIKQSAVPREIKQNVEGISFEQHQQCVVLMAKRLRIKMGDNVKGLPEYSFNPDRLPSPLDDNKIKESRIRPVDVHIVRAFARIFRAIADQELYHNFCDQEPLPTRPAENEEASISRNENICLSVSKTRVMRLSRFIDLLRSLGIVNSAGTLDSVKSLTRLSFREVKEIFANVVGLSSTSFNVTSSPEQEQPSQLAKNGPGLIFDSFVDAMRLIAAKIDASAAPYMFPVSRLSGSTYPSFTGSSMLGAILSIYRDSSSLLCSLSMKELLTLVEFMKHKRLKSGYVLCSQNHLATETPIVISGSLKQEVSDDGHSKIEYLHRGSWCEVHFLLTSRHKYISTLTAQSDVELALISSEAFEAFCNRIDWMHARRQTETDAETLKERLFMHRSSCADILKEDVANEGNSPSAINGWECGSPTSPGCTITSQKGAPLALEQGMNNVDLREDLNDDELHQMHGELLKQDRVMKGEKVEGVDRPKTAVMRSDYAQQLHELGCYYFELRHISAARRLLCEACRIRMELFGAHDSCTLSSVRVLEQVDKWAYRQVDETTRAKVIERQDLYFVVMCNEYTMFLLPQRTHPVKNLADLSKVRFRACVVCHRLRCK